MTSRPGPRDLRASDADRERVIAVLNEAAADGRLTLGEHSERAERAYSARTLGELAALTTDLAEASAQPIRLDTRRPVAGIFGRERRDGRWVVPERLAVTAIFGEVVLDLREAMLQSQRITVLATVMGGTVQLIVPEGIAVEVTGTAMLSRKNRTSSAGGLSRKNSTSSAGGLSRKNSTSSAGGLSRKNRQATQKNADAPVPQGMPVIEVRAFALGGRVKVVRPRKSRWRGPLIRRRS